MIYAKDREITHTSRPVAPEWTYDDGSDPQATEPFVSVGRLPARDHDPDCEYEDLAPIPEPTYRLTPRREWKARSDEEKRLQRLANTTGPFDRLKGRRSFSESAAHVIYGRGVAYWRLKRDYDPDTQTTGIVDIYMTQPNRHDVSGASKRDLVWSHLQALAEDRRQNGSPI